MGVSIDVLRGVLKNIESELEINIVYILYNEQKEIERAHIKKIKKFLDSLKYESAIVILEGIGGDINAGKLLALELGIKFRNGMFIAIPNFALSSLVYSIFPSRVLIMDNSGYVGPVEPLIKAKQSNIVIPISVLQLMKSSDIEQRNKAIKCWIDQGNFILELLEHFQPSIIHEYNQLHVDQIVDIFKLFLCSMHDRKITKTDLIKSNLHVLDATDKEFWNYIKLFVSNRKSEIITNRHIQFVIGDSNSEFIFT
ncbi:hypothetical protein HYX04_02280 [Candidatus Woesearchaeota archaeon]|nr:hypothetical protein [Candidatus Woesearchaeota archaeon]